MSRVSTVWLSTVAMLLLYACSKETVSPQNHAPHIVGVFLDAAPPIGINQSMTIRCEAEDPDGDELSYGWTSLSGSFMSEVSKSEVTWRAPATPTQCNIVVEVSDGIKSSVDSIVIAIKSVPVPRLTITPESGTTQTDFTFDASDSEDLQTPREQLEVRWNLDGDWTPWSTEKSRTHRYSSGGLKSISLQVRNNDDLQASKDSLLAVESIPFVIENLGVIIEPLNPVTGYAGDFYFSRSLYRVFWEFGAQVKDTAGNIKELGEFSYIVRKDAPVLAIAEGEVVAVEFQAESDDYEFTIRSENDSTFDVIYDHLINLRITVGERVQPGDTLANPHVWPDWIVGHFEITIANRTTQLFYCPFCFFNEASLEEYQQKISRLIGEWEEYIGDTTIYDEENWVSPGCRYESLPAF